MACNKFLRHSIFPVPLNFNHKFAGNNSQGVLKLIIKKVPSVKLSEYTSHRHYSIFSSKQSWHRSRNLHPISSCINSVLFLSTNDSNDKFHIVVTNPSPSSAHSADISPGISSTTETAESSSAVASTPSIDVSDATSTFSPTSELSEIAVTLENEVQTVTQLVEPSLASLGLAHWTPVGLVQMGLEYLHIVWDMPWWMAITMCTVIARILLVPILIKTQKNALKMSNHTPQLQYLQAKFGEARRSGNTLEASRYANEIVHFMKQHDIHPFKSALWPLAQAPVFISFFLALRAMAKAPVESMTYGGIGWVTDLTIPDPYYILPVVSCGTLYVILKIGAESGIKMENLKLAKYMMQALPVIALPFCIHFPAAVLYYWVTTNFCTLFIVSVLKIKPIRQYLNLPEQKPIDPKFVLPKKGFVDGVKEAFEDQKALANIEERRRMDEIRFLKAGTGPIPRTYSYDPTKPRPANAAAIAKRKQSVLAKEREI